jgi:hypothetical protein
MGQAKIKQRNRERFLLQHPFCVYCGAVATTTDHCPPRCFFDQRHWPETYEFPACAPCNEEARYDEQALAVLARIQLRDQHDKEPGLTEWKKLLDGVRNNQPELLIEWGDVSASKRKRVFREMFGPQGDYMRSAGWGAMNLGPLSRAAIDRFTIKLGKALYYRYNHQIFDGDIYIKHVDPPHKEQGPRILGKILNFAPQFATPQRNAKSLADRFLYRFNHDACLGVIYAVVQFGLQLVFQIMAVRQDLARELEQNRAAAGEEMPTRGVFRCTLKSPPKKLIEAE